MEPKSRIFSSNATTVVGKYGIANFWRGRRLWTKSMDYIAYFLCRYICVVVEGPWGIPPRLGGLEHFWDEDDNTKVIITLLGKLKGERHDRWHVLLCCLRTPSGIDVAQSVRCLKELKSSQCFFRPQWGRV